MTLYPAYPGPTSRNASCADCLRLGKTYADKFGIVPATTAAEILATASIIRRWGGEFIDRHDIVLLVHPRSSHLEHAYAEFYSGDRDDIRDRWEAAIALGYRLLHAPVDIDQSGFRVEYYKPDAEPESVRLEALWFARGLLVDDKKLIDSYNRQDRYIPAIAAEFRLNEGLVSKRLKVLGVIQNEAA